jgi:hypothetical protein
MADNDKQQEEPQSNLERLQSRLDKDSLAGKLIAARIAAGNGDPLPSLRGVILERVEELKRKYESVPDNKT